MNAELLAELELPADQIRAVRLVAARIAATEGFDDETAEDVKLAVGEAFSRLAAVPAQAGLRVLIQRDEDSLTVDFPGFPALPVLGATELDQTTVNASDSDFGWLILTAVVPSLQMAGDTLRLAWPLPRLAAPHG